MKPLKDIGREVVELSDMEFVDPDTVDWGDEPETPKFTAYSDAERRELVREAVEKWNRYREHDELRAAMIRDGKRTPLDILLEQFLKSEGL